MKVFVTDGFTFPLPPGHRFPVEKYEHLRRRVEATGLVPPSAFVVPAAATRAQVLLAHSPEYWRKMTTGELTREEVRDLGLPWSPELVERSLRSVGATIEAAGAALDDGVAVTLAGGTHHASRDRGEGFCLFNDAVVAVRVWQQLGRIRRAVVIDLDVHQGNGTAELAAGDETLYTFSVHCASNYPAHKPPSDVDVALPDRTGDEEYLAVLDDALPRVLDAAAADLAIYLAGADPFVGDRLGRLSLTKAGLLERDRRVLRALGARGLPVVVTMGGGYARQLEETVDIQLRTVLAALEREAGRPLI